MKRIHPEIRQRAREFRRPQTPSEQILWQRLRGKQAEGLKLRRQHPIGPYIVDFYCASARLVIELDGDSHAFQVEYDQERTAWLQAQDYHVLRFSNTEVHQNCDAVVEKILETAKFTSPPSPFQGEGKLPGFREADEGESSLQGKS